MSQSERPEPECTADEQTMLVGWLDFYRATLRAQVAGLTAEQLQQRIEPSVMTLGGLISHLALVESHWFSYVFAGEDEREPWASADWDADEDWDWTRAKGQSVAELLELMDAETEHSRAILAEHLPRGLDQLAERTRSNGSDVSLRWIVTHMIEEYARHAGHADLLRETIDGKTHL